MTEPNSQSEKPEEIPLLNHWEDKFLKLCSEKGDEGIARWNQWRGKHPNKQIWMQGANLCDAHLKKAYLRGAHLEGATFWNCDLQSGHLADGHVEGADLRWAHLECAIFVGAHLQAAKLSEAHLQGANLSSAHLEGSNLANAHLERTSFHKPHLQGANFETAIVDGSTVIWKPEVNQYRKGNRFTDFSGVPLGAVRIDPGTKQLLEYNIRRKNWEEWYKKGHLPQRILKRLFVWPFWLISDYGLRTWRIIGTFFVLALLFAAIYSNLGYWFPPGVVGNLEVDPHLPLWHYFLLLLLRPIYFSIVTMTTLGFGDMYADAQSIWGHILLTLQVILGYVLLGALVTRFAVLFTAGGPAGKFADEEEEKDKTQQKDE